MSKSKILIVDDDGAMRGLMRARLEGSYEVFDTGDPEQALGLAMKHKPDAIFLDLMMPKLSGFELCQSLHSLSYTSRIRIFIITGTGAGAAQEYCKNLGATGFFEKPVDFTLLKHRLAEELGTQRPERRRQSRVRMRVSLKLRGTDAAGKSFEEVIVTENVSAEGFLCNCAASLATGARVEVFMVGGREWYVGRARVMRRESDLTWQRYGFHLEEKKGEWVVQAVTIRKPSESTKSHNAGEETPAVVPMYKVTPKEQLVSVKFGKRLSIADIKSYVAALRSDSLFDPSFSEIIDISEVEDFQLRAEQTMALADSVDPFSIGATRAFVAQTEAQIHSARMHQVLRDDEQNTRIFSSVADARKWIEERRTRG